ncbi:hypothetical protein G7Z17_g2130 [Cylindrodendrum hubeiense]|uniref:Clr5 domain-containing protein n=1 Tax=Cylindrodendrum hubeiense TaxID=595255 RepID=A0A9P5HLH4_9HYPO|nr:hypothetical protein G7Z17_g2130 [Cylindrodendrum hubeiense]
MLYSSEARPLKEVIDIMGRTYNFNATPRMYKHRFRKWGLDKKYKEKEVIQMSLLKQQRDALGKQSIFVIRGKRVDWEQVEKYIHRRPDLETKIKAGMLTLSSSNFDLFCRSPSPEPVLHVSSTLQYTDELLRLLDCYYNAGLNETLSRHGADEASDSAVSIRCYRRLDYARMMILANKMKPGFESLNKSLDDLRSMVKAQDPTLLFYLCDIATAFDNRHKALAFEIFRHAYDILSVAFGDLHPLVRLMGRLVRLPDKDRYGLIAVILKAAVDNFGRLDISGRIVERLHCHYFLLLDYMATEGINAKASFPKMDVASMDAVSVAYLGRFADRLIFSRDFEEAERMAELMLPWLQDPLNAQHSAWIDLQLVYYHLKSFGGFSRGDNAVGEVWARKIEQHVACYFENW